MKGGEFSSFPFNEMTASYYIMLLCRKTHVFDKKEKLMLEINLDCMQRSARFIYPFCIHFLL